LSTTTAVLQRPRATKVPAKGAPCHVADHTINGLVELFQMLGDKSRLRILLALAAEGEMHVSGLCSLLGHSQPAVSHHLALLRSHRLVTCRREGKNIYYANDSALVRDLLAQFFGQGGAGEGQIQLDGCSLAFKSR
jgi:DNA-binding transcriptional ArsR family regulator